MQLHWHIGDVVRKLREQNGWTQTKLGEKSGGLNKATIVRVEEGGNVKRDTLESIARGLNTTMAQLYALVPSCVDSHSQQQETQRSAAAADTHPTQATGTAGTHFRSTTPAPERPNRKRIASR